MTTVIIACHTLKDELNMAIDETECSYPVLWVESGLHLYTGSLNKRLQEELNRLENVDQVLLAFGFCGNALLGLTIPSYRLIFPRVDDCISLLLGSQQAREAMSEEMGTYYLTKGWLQFESNIWQEYQHSVKRYGKDRTDRVFKQILAHYRRLAVIDTGAYEVAEFLKATEKIAETLGLLHQVVPGSTRYLKKLLTGPWDDEFVIIEPGTNIALEHIHLDPRDLTSEKFLRLAH
ncbi:MAG: DUF1638 domain-containing protein [Peptococcaceae bacterium]|nr:DUF1638 domain-containing protein [Peptococcaceae bacterium]